MQGDHSPEPAPLTVSKEPWLVFPIDLPGFALNHFSIGLFNTLYYNKQLSKTTSSLVDYEPFFYPLDKVLHWNRMYGKNGLLQFQCVLPWEADQRRHHRRFSRPSPRPASHRSSPSSRSSATSLRPA